MRNTGTQHNHTCTPYMK